MSPGHYGSLSEHIPAFCDPVDETLATISGYWGTCIPTYLALASTALGTCSIVAWLFAQLPQIYKNLKIQSTAGLSASFLLVWCVGDLSNLVGALLTGQATWQVVVAGYYTTVDFVLVGQYVWYERLGHGRKARMVLQKRREFDENGNGNGHARGGEREPLLASGNSTTANGSATASTQTRTSTHVNGDLNDFKFPALVNPGAQEKDISPQDVSSRRKNVLMPRPTGSFVQSPNLVLLVACLCLALGQASPVSHSASAPMYGRSITAAAAEGEDTAEIVGRIISWCSTFLYLISRLPQLVKNYRRKSTAGLSPTLFAAAFCGNLFYSTSLLTNPLAWASYPPHGHRGWAGRHGSVQSEWVISAAPFFLGAAGVLALDAAVGVQFLVYGDGRKQRYTPRVPVVVVDGSSSPTTGTPGGAATPQRSHVLAVPPGGSHQQPEAFEVGSWRRVSGYMRGWVPSFSPGPGSFSNPGGYMSAALGAGRAARDRIASGFATPRTRSRSRGTSPDLTGEGGSAGVPVNRNLRGIRAEAEAWESRRNSRQGSVASTSSQRDGDTDLEGGRDRGDSRSSGEDRPLLEGEAGRYGSL